ncbi:hypothetical protein JTB14_018383 [Gonioctena quinquepunctata]|nr:hypothetical protein JTB14_018383 [Gonioctena quinquepunctata]
MKKVKHNEEQEASTSTSASGCASVQSGLDNRDDSVSASLDPPIFKVVIDCHEDNFDESTTEPSLTGKILAQTVLKFMNKYGLNLNNYFGIGTDTCSVMLSEQKGAVSELLKYLPNSMKCPCHSHSLNLSISKSTSVQDIRNSVEIMKGVNTVFNASSKRNTTLKNSSEQLKKLCETRWTERHESVLRFKTNLVKVVESLQIISSWKDRESSSKAQ